MTGHAWPLIFTRRKNSGPKKRTARIQIPPDQRRRGHVLSGSVGLTEPLRREEPRGQLRLSLTTTYHEWPVNYGRGADLARPGHVLCPIFHSPGEPEGLH